MADSAPTSSHSERSSDPARMPLARARSGLSATARSCRPKLVRYSSTNTTARLTSAMPATARSLGSTRTPPKFQARTNGRSKVRWSCPAKNEIRLRSTKPRPMAASSDDTMGWPASLRKISAWLAADSSAVTAMATSAAAHSGRPPSSCTPTAT